LSVNGNYSQDLLDNFEKGSLYDFQEFIVRRRIKKNTSNPSNLG
jgi:hypothetical protein